MIGGREEGRELEAGREEPRCGKGAMSVHSEGGRVAAGGKACGAFPVHFGPAVMARVLPSDAHSQHIAIHCVTANHGNGRDHPRPLRAQRW